jgi:hypothetical protein
MSTSRLTPKLEAGKATMESKLAAAQSLADQLSPIEQVRLMAYLTARMAQVVISLERTAAPEPGHTDEAWKAFWRIGDALSAGDTPEAATLTATVIAMRR